MWLIQLLLIITISYNEAVMDFSPVFLLDADSVLSQVVIRANPFQQTVPEKFVEVIEEARRNSKIVVIFVEETFSTEDTSLKDNLGSPYHHLHKGLTDDKVKYLPSVIEPYRTLKSIFPHQSHNVFYLSSTSKKIQIYSGRYTHFYIYFKDSKNETRVDALRRHDVLMKEVYFVIRQIAAGPIVGFYTGKTNPVVLDRQNFISMKPAPIKATPGVTITSTGGIFKLSGVYSLVGDRKATFSQIPLVAEETWSGRRLNTRMAYTDFEIEFSFSFKDDCWIADSVSLMEWGEEVGRTKMAVGAPWGWSYVCGEPLVLVNTRDGSAVIQPFNTAFLREDNNSTWDGQTTIGNGTSGFGPAIHCGPYFNPRILAGLMVTAMCLSILMYGIGFLYDCKSNDKLDDPHVLT
ncbi:unnamed protein product [Leptidea sinapis]|uniref:V-type proton ATPase subunit S1/VOA1 transmembrane domain-containing protein n=1 Tax=Leptidea sinapis TaxID=189913 RepID=A0A5E4QS23_9NEOP|nr:unnamed protein product [Leptidea sinapis]